MRWNNGNNYISYIRCTGDEDERRSFAFFLLPFIQLEILTFWYMLINVNGIKVTHEPKRL